MRTRFFLPLASLPSFVLLSSRRISLIMASFISFFWSWRCFSFSSRSLRFSSFDFFFGRVDWFSAARSICPMTLIFDTNSGWCILNISSFSSLFSETASSVAAGAGSALETGTGSTTTGAVFSSSAAGAGSTTGAGVGSGWGSGTGSGFGASTTGAGSSAFTSSTTGISGSTASSSFSTVCLRFSLSKSIFPTGLNFGRTSSGTTAFTTSSVFGFSCASLS